MNLLPDEIFDIALTRLLKGESIEAITNDYPEFKQELVSLLSVSEMGINIPKLTPPIAYKKHLYAEKVSVTNKAWDFLRFSRVAIVPIALIVALLGGQHLVKATNDSLPGDKLYTLKRATENARLAITRNPEQLAVIHVQLMQNRINEVRQAASTGNETAENAAIAELQSQTTKTFAEVAPVATANAISKQDSTLLDTLLAVNKQQKDVLQDLQKTDEDSATKTVATTALEDNKKNDQTLAKIIATVNDQTLADMPNKISVTGDITSKIGNKIVVEKNTFTIDDKTSISDVDGQLTTGTTNLMGQVTITGVRMSDGTIVAKQILVLPTDTGTVKGATDTAPTQTTKTTPAPTPTTKSTEPSKPTQTAQPVTTQTQPSAPASDNTDEPDTQTSNQATGSFIAEPSTQLYNQ